MKLWSTEVCAGVVMATYDHAPMNYFCAEGAGELVELIETWRAPSIRAVVLTGGRQGKFITHYSVEELERYAADPKALREMGTALNDGYHAMLQSLSDLPKPVIAAINGDAMGGGLELCLACDIRIAARGDHRFGLPEAKLGILPGGSGTQRLTRLIGVGRAIEFILRGRVLKPEDALAIGLVHELADDARVRARQVAEELATLPPVALQQIKRAVYQGADRSLADGLKLEAGAFLATMLSQDARTAMRAYLAQPLEQRRDWIENPPAATYTGS